MRPIFRMLAGSGGLPPFVAPPPPSALMPTAVPNLEAWYDAADASTFSLTGSLVDQWDDKSGNDRHLIGTTTTRPPYVTGAQPYVELSGGEFLVADLVSAISTAEATWIMVVELEKPAPAAGYLYIQGLNNANSSYALTVSTQIQIGSSFQVGILTGGNNALLDEQRAIISRWDATQNDLGTDNGMFDVVVDSFTPVSANKITVGQLPNGTQRGYGKIHEIISFSRKLLTTEVEGILAYLATKWTNVQAPLASSQAFDVFLVAGQSNCVTGAPLEAEDQAIFDGVWMFNDGIEVAPQIARGVNPMVGPDYRPANTGFAIDFGRDYVFSQRKEILLVQEGRGSSSFFGNEWNPGDTEYEAAIARINRVMALYPGSDFKGILWHQGENDALQGVTQVSYTTSLSAMVADMRSRITGASIATPIVVGGMLPSWVAGDPSRQPVQDALEDVPNQIANSAYADSVDLLGHDGVHFTSESMRILGTRYFEEYLGN